MSRLTETPKKEVGNEANFELNTSNKPIISVESIILHSEDEAALFIQCLHSQLPCLRFGR